MLMILCIDLDSRPVRYGVRYSLDGGRTLPQAGPFATKHEAEAYRDRLLYGAAPVWKTCLVLWPESGRRRGGRSQERGVVVMATSKANDPLGLAKPRETTFSADDVRSYAIRCLNPIAS